MDGKMKPFGRDLDEMAASIEEIKEKDLTDQIATAQHRLNSKGVTENEKKALTDLIENAERMLREIKGK